MPLQGGSWQFKSPVLTDEKPRFTMGFSISVLLCKTVRLGHIQSNNTKNGHRNVGHNQERYCKSFFIIDFIKASSLPITISSEKDAKYLFQFDTTLVSVIGR